MILSDKSIKEKIKSGEISIEPFDISHLQPASYDLHLGNTFMMFIEDSNSIIDVKQPVSELMQKVELNEGDPFIIQPGQFVLAKIAQVTGVDSKHVGRLEGKSSLARLGLIIHATAGFLDPGNKLNLTLEMVNLSPLPIKLYVGMKIAQIAFEEIDQMVEKPYGSSGLNSKYFGNSDVKESQMHKNF